LKFDFSKINAGKDLTEANESLIKFLNSSIRRFYKTYAIYLGRNVADPCQDIDSKEPKSSFDRCCESVQDAIELGGRLAGIKGIYVLVDEYDAFPNEYLETANADGRPKTAWEGTTVGQTFKSCWATVKSLCTDGFIQRLFITGISPLSLSGVGSACNIVRNVSFQPNVVV